MTDFVQYKKEVYATPLDILVLSMDFIRETTHSSKIFVDDARAMMALYRARGIIDLKLGNVVSGVTTFNTTPYASPPIKPAADSDGNGENTGSGVLNGIIPASTAVTERWIITFSTTSAFSVTGSISGAQGTGSTATLFTSTNSYISIPADAWSGTPAVSDKFYVATYKQVPEIVMLASMLATGLIYKGSAAGNSPGDAPSGAKLYDDAMKMLDSIASGESSLIGVDMDLDTRDLQTIYEPDVFGGDSSNYSEDERSKFAYSSTTRRPWWAV